MCLAGSLFPVMNGLAKLLAETYSFEQVVWARTLSHLILVLIVLVLLSVAIWQMTKIFDLTQVGTANDDSQIATDNDNNVQGYLMFGFLGFKLCRGWMRRVISMLGRFPTNAKPISCCQQFALYLLSLFNLYAAKGLLLRHSSFLLIL